LVAVCSVLLTVILINVRSSVANVLTSLLITITFLVQFDLLLESAVVCVLACLATAWLLKIKFQILSLPVLIMLILGAFLDSYYDDDKVQSFLGTTSVNSNLRPVVHILLDSFIGIDGLPPYPASQLMKFEINKFFDDFNFQVFSRAYSRYYQTGVSLYSAMNFENDGESIFTLELAARREHVLESNALFDELEEAGYRINVYQTGHLDFCQSNPENLERCWNYTHPNVDTLQHVKQLRSRVRMLASVILNQSTLITDLLESRYWLVNQGIAMHDPRVFSKLREDVLDKPDGR